MPYNDTTLYDRYTVSAYCQHCGQYLTTIAGVERGRLPAVRAQVREIAQEHADLVGRWIDVT